MFTFDSSLGRRLVPSVLVVSFLALCATSLQRTSATFDESHYLGIGLHLLSGRSGEIPGQGLHPPLTYLWHSLPLLWLVDVPTDVWSDPHGDSRGQRLIALRHDDWVLNSARLAMLPAGALLCLVVFRWARRLYGHAGGVLALTLCAFSPNLIAHAQLITTDVTLALFTVLSLYLLWRLADEPGWKRLVPVGISIGLLLLSKYTALVLIPILLVTDLTYRALIGRRSWFHWAPIGAIAAFVTWAGYGFDPAFAVRYFDGALFQWRQTRLPHEFFLMGDYSSDGWWYFYLVTMGIKVPVGTLALVLASFVVRVRSGWKRFDTREVWLWVPIVTFVVYLSFLNTIHNGIRYLLPVGPLALIAAGSLARAGGSRVWVIGPAAWVVGAACWIWPDYIAYHNELIGGPRNAYRFTSDSNLDWGQDLPQLEAWMVEHDVPRVGLAYFGSADPAHYGIDYDYLPSANSRLPRTPPAQVAARVVALSAYQYQMVGFPDRTVYAEFHCYEPNDLAGYSILIFDRDHLIPRRTTLPRCRSQGAP